MFQIPQARKQEKVFIIEALFVFMLVIIILASFAVFIYWYIFGDANPFDKKNKPIEAVQKTLYINPDYTLGNVIMKKATK